MNPLLILLIGIVVVVGGILALRLHAFLALILGALVVAMLTPDDASFRFALRPNTIPLASVDGDTVTLKTTKSLPEGAPLIVLRPGEGHRKVGSIRVGDAQGGGAKPQAGVPARVAEGNVEGTDVAIDPASYAAADKRRREQTIGDRVAQGFGETCLSIGILIAMAAIVGETLLASGAAERIVGSFRRALGDNRASLAFLISGVILGIPVFFDTVFYLLIPLGKVMRVRSGRDYTLYVLSIVAGATMTHSLVPPTPGPLAVAAQLNVSLATMILGGLAVGAITAAAGYVYALYANRRWDVPLRASAGLTEEDLRTIDARDPATLPSLWVSLLPIFLPVLTISLAAVVEAQKMTGPWVGVVRTLGDKNISLAIAAGIGLLLMFRQPSCAKGSTGKAVGEALASAGVIILVTSAGGAFGYVLRQTDIAASISHLVPAGKLALLPLAFLLAALVRTAQGSATVAMITAAGIVSPLAAATADLGFHPVYLALAIGCGSKPIMWMNDSGFWIIGKMSGFTEAETLKTATVMMTIMGVVGLGATMLGAWLFPLV